MSRQKLTPHLIAAALLILGAAIFAAAQNDNPAVKHNARGHIKKTASPVDEPFEDVKYSYEFKKAEFTIAHVLIEHDSHGKGTVTFERLGELEAIVEPLALSESARERIKALWDTLRFLDSNSQYQSDRGYPHLGTMWLRMTRGTRERVAEFNWTNEPTARSLTEEYKRVANQVIFVFDIGVSQANQPLNSPKLLDLLDRYITSKQLSDPMQLIPLLRELSTDERLPLMSRNKAGRILKRLEN